MIYGIEVGRDSRKDNNTRKLMVEGKGGLDEGGRLGLDGRKSVIDDRRSLVPFRRGAISKLKCFSNGGIG